MPTIAALIVAAGRGSRFGSEVPKQYANLAGKPIIRHAINALINHPAISYVQPVIHQDDARLFEDAAAGLQIATPIFGGETRQDSVRLGLEALASLNPDFVLIHDGARPFVTSHIIEGVISALTDGARGAIPGLPIPDTLKRIDGESKVIETVSRTNMVRAQTPQGFHFDDLLAAHRTSRHLTFTDDAAVMEQAGHTIAVVTGDDNNVKVTEADDLTKVAATLLETRTGVGFDVHRFGPGDGVTLGSIHIPMNKSLIGHSDADVVLHAATDAILGALSDGDIGLHFPPSDENNRDLDSRIFLAFALDRLAGSHGSLIHLDLTVICEQPKLSRYRAQMRDAIAEIAGVPTTRISVKATTTEGLGFTGRGEGIACQAVATIRALPVEF